MSELASSSRLFSKPKVLYIVNSLNLGGTEQLVVQMSRAISDEFQVTVICLDDLGIWAKNLRQSGIPVYCLFRQPGIDVSMAIHIARFCKHQRIDIIHAHQCTPWFYAALSRYLWRRPKLLFEEHGRHYPEKDSLKKRIVNKALIQPMTHRMVAVSGDVKNRLVRYEGGTPEKIEVVYNGVYSQPSLGEEEKRQLKHSLGFTQKDFIVGFVGRFDDIKNLPLLVKSLKRCHSTHPEIKGLLIGDGPAFRQVSALLKESELTGTVRLTGYKANAARMIQCMNLFVLPSFSEGTSLALLEALAAGVPTVVSEVGGNPEIVQAGSSGWVFPSDSMNDLTTCILEAFESPSKIREFSQTGRDRFQKLFSFDVMIRRYKAMYLELLKTFPHAQ